MDNGNATIIRFLSTFRVKTMTLPITTDELTLDLLENFNDPRYLNTLPTDCLPASEATLSSN